jgi:hypothetical protein
MSQAALQFWKEKLEFLGRQEAIASDGSDKFKLQKDIEECLTKIAELEPQRQANPSKPHVPKVSIADLPAGAQHFVGREQRLAELDAAWNDPTTNIISLVAFGGVGKSALVAQWLRQMGADDWRGAEVVLGNSFYSQGARDDAQVSADAFIDKALRFLGDDNSEAGSPWDKGERLAQLVRQRKTLLVLDGMEPLQWSPSSGDPGRIKDPGLQALVKELAYSNPGLCVITTRQPVADIPGTPQIDLEQLSPQAGAALLTFLKVKGTQVELEDASRQVQGHGLALNLLGTYLSKACNGDVRRIGDIDLSKADQRLGGHARKIMATYETWLGESVELSILRLLGLFDRPAEPDCLEALRAEPAIPGLTDALVNLSTDDWNWAISNLRDYGLLARDTAPIQNLNSPIQNPKSKIQNTLDAHPLVREHFAQQIETDYPDATCEAHRRLYEHLKQSAPELPETLPAMMPLYQAVAHGCKAGLHQEVLDNVFYKRVRRQSEAFSISKLGSFGAEIAAIANFFDQTWSQPAADLKGEYKGYVLNIASFALRALGRLAETQAPMIAALEECLNAQNYEHAAVQAGILSELYLTLGNVAAAVQAAEQSVELGDRSNNTFQRMARRTKIADALLQSNRLQQSQLAFQDAEKIQVEQQPQYPLLYSLWGFHYCNLLLEEPSAVSAQLTAQPQDVSTSMLNTAGDRCREVRDRAGTTLRWARENNISVLDVGLNTLTLGRTWLLEADLTLKGDPSADISILLQTASDPLHQSISLLRQAGTQNHIPRAFLARATLFRLRGEVEPNPTEKQEHFAKADRDLAEVEQIAGRSGMVPFLVDAAIERCRLALAQGDGAQARHQLDEAKARVKQTERPYEPHIPTWDEWEPPEYIGVIQKGDIVGYYRRNREIALLEGQV